MSASRKNAIRYLIVFASLALLFCFAVVKSINTGSVDNSLKSIMSIVFGRDGTEQAAYNIIWKTACRDCLPRGSRRRAVAVGFLLQTFSESNCGAFVLA